MVYIWCLWVYGIILQTNCSLADILIDAVVIDFLGRNDCSNAICSGICYETYKGPLCGCPRGMHLNNSTQRCEGINCHPHTKMAAIDLFWSLWVRSTWNFGTWAFLLDEVLKNQSSFWIFCSVFMPFLSKDLVYIEFHRLCIFEH